MQAEKINVIGTEIKVVETQIPMVTLTMTPEEANILYNIALADIRVPRALHTEGTENYHIVSDFLGRLQPILRGVIR